MSQVDVQWPSDDDNDDHKHDDNNEANDTSSTGEDHSNDIENSDEKKSNDNEGKEMSSEGNDNQQNEHKDDSNNNKSENVSSDAVVNNSSKSDNKKFSMSKMTKKTSGSSMGGKFVRPVVEVFLILVVVGLGLWSWNLYNDRKNLESQVSSLNQNPQTKAQKQTQIVVNQVSKLMQLPTNETPTIVLVSNSTEAKKQSAFFQNSQNGDKALLYIKAGEAILYRPSTNKIIVVAPITYNSASASTNKPASTTK